MSDPNASDQLDQIERIFQAAQSCPPEKRDAYLIEACAGDPVLLNELRSLLEADQVAEQEAFLRNSALTKGKSVNTETDFRGRRIGPYTILQRLGRGGMGDVFLAQQDRPFKRRVALKIIRRGMDTEEVLLRFKMERQILASLNHPNIARLLDGGITDEGLPYFAMEYIDGLPITEYSDQKTLTLEQRLHLFQNVCEAVHYAHQNLVIHRDLKPSNILVNQKGVVKLLDFGIAKLLNPNLSPIESPITRTDLRVMTPEYASPEQVRGESLTTASDVYALGVILYELLSGYRPYRLQRRSSEEMEAIVCNTEVERPSTRVSKSETITRGDGSTSTLTPDEVGARRSITADKLRRRLKGDLDNIVMMTLRKEASRRYRSAEQLGEDLDRYLKGQPVAARPATVGYRVKKFVGRHRVGVVTASLVVLSLLAGLQIALWQAGVARDHAAAAEAARIQAEEALQQSEEVTDFLMGLFSANDPASALGEEITARQLLERGRTRTEELAEQPAVQARMMDVMGRVYQSLGQYDRAQPLLEDALKIRRDHLGGSHPDVVTSLDNVARLHREKGEYERAETLYRQSLALAESLFDAGHPRIAESKNNLAILLRRVGEVDEAARLYREALAIFRQHEGYESDVANALNNLAVLFHDIDHEAADSLYRQSLDMNVRLYGDMHPELVRVLNNHALLLRDMGRLDEAEPQMRRAMEIRRKLLGEEHPNLANTMNNLATILRDMGRYEEAGKLMDDALAMRIKLLGENHVDVAFSLESISSLYAARGDYEAAEPHARRALQLKRASLGGDHLGVGRSADNLGYILFNLGRLSEAETQYNEALRIFRRQLDPDHAWIQQVEQRMEELKRAS